MVIAVQQQRLEQALERIQRALEQRRALRVRDAQDGQRAAQLEAEMQALRQENARLAVALRAAEARGAELHQLCEQAAARVDRVIGKLDGLMEGAPWPK